MAGDLLLTGLSGLNAFRTVLNTTSHNISNAQTEGYSRQRVDLETQQPQFSGSGYIGTGVKSGDISRQYDTFLTSQFRSSVAASSELNTYYDLSSQVDDLLVNPEVGLSTALQDFFNGTQELSDNPTSVASRQVLLSDAESLVNRYHLLDSRLEETVQQINIDLGESVDEINRLAQSIADINLNIIAATGQGAGSPPNDLLDRRDLMVEKLAEQVNVTTLEQDDGALNVFIGNGQSLVLGARSLPLDLQNGSIDASQQSIVFVQGGTSIDVTQFISGGVIGGTLRFRDEILNPAINSLGQSAAAFSLALNDLQTNGVDLNGNQGTNFFTIPQPNILSASTSLQIDFSAGLLDPSTTDYQLDVVDDGTNTNYTLTRLSDGSSVLTNSFPSGGSSNFTFDGMDFSLGPVPANTTETYLIQPVKEAARDIELLVNNAQSIAAGLPVVADANQANAGTGELKAIQVSGFQFDTLVPPLSADVVLTNTGPNTFSSTVGTVSYDATTDRYTLTDPSFGDISFKIAGVMAVNDTFDISSNFGADFGIGDNRNANLMANLQVATNIAGGTTTYQQQYGQLVADIGGRTRTAETSALAQEGLLNQTVLRLDEVSGVNLDEEAANLVRFQQAYQAASQVIVVARTIFDTLINAF